MATPQTKPFYLLPPGHPVIATYKEFFEQQVGSATKTITLDVPPEIVDEGYTEMPQEIILALQHYPQHIEKLLFSLEFQFQQIADSELYFQPMDWKSDPRYYRWFGKMGEFSLTLFFLNDNDARFYALAGDLLADGKFTFVQEGSTEKRSKIEASPEVQKIINTRVYNACYMLLIYCHASGFDPKPYIEGFMAEYNAGFTLESVYKAYTIDVEQGAVFMVKGSKE